MIAFNVPITYAHHMKQWWPVKQWWVASFPSTATSTLLWTSWPGCCPPWCSTLGWCSLLSNYTYSTFIQRANIYYICPVCVVSKICSGICSIFLQFVPMTVRLQFQLGNRKQKWSSDVQTKTKPANTSHVNLHLFPLRHCTQQSFHWFLSSSCTLQGSEHQMKTFLANRM